MKSILIQYHWEPEGWWADSDDIPGWLAAGATFEEVQALAHEGVAEFVDGEVVIREAGGPIPTASTSAGSEPLSDAIMCELSYGTMMFFSQVREVGTTRQTVAATRNVEPALEGSLIPQGGTIAWT